MACTWLAACSRTHTHRHVLPPCMLLTHLPPLSDLSFSQIHDELLLEVEEGSVDAVWVAQVGGKERRCC